VVITKASTEEIARYDTTRFEVYLPPSATIDVGPDFKLPSSNPDWPLFRIPASAPIDSSLNNVLTSSIFGTRDEIVGFRPWSPDQPGLPRVDRMVISDRCGVIGVNFRLSDATLSLTDGRVRSLCKNSKLRAIIGQQPTVVVTGKRLLLRTKSQTVALSFIPSAPFTVVSIDRVQTTTNENAVKAEVQMPGSSGLRTFSTSDGCNSVTTAVLFAGGRFAFDPERIQTAMACANPATTAAAVMLRNGTGLGTYTQQGSTVTLRFVDGTIAVLTVTALA
jgi:heat shock protein HslJ